MKKIIILFAIIIAFMLYIITPTYAYTSPPNSANLSTTIIDVGLDKEHISFTKDNGDYGLSGLVIYGLYAYAESLDTYDYYTWAVVQDESNPFKIYVSEVEQVTETPIYYVRLNYTGSSSTSYISFFDKAFNQLFTIVASNVNSTWTFERMKPVDDVLQQITNAYNSGYDDGIDDAYEDAMYYYHENGFGSLDSTSFSFDAGYGEAELNLSPISFLGLISASGMLLNIIFTTEIFRGITIGLFILIPLLFALLGLFLRLRKGG